MRSGNVAVVAAIVVIFTGKLPSLITVTVVAVLLEGKVVEDVSPNMFACISALSDDVVLAENIAVAASVVAGLSTLAPAVLVVFGVEVIDKDATTKHKPTNTVRARSLVNGYIKVDKTKLGNTVV